LLYIIIHIYLIILGIDGSVGFNGHYVLKVVDVSL